MARKIKHIGGMLAELQLVRVMNGEKTVGEELDGKTEAEIKDWCLGYGWIIDDQAAASVRKNIAEGGFKPKAAA